MHPHRYTMTFEVPSDLDIMQAYLHKNARSRRSDIARIRRALRKLGGRAAGQRR